MVQRDDNLTLVLYIERYPCLYNQNLAEYSKKDVTEKAWTEISKRIKLSVNDCKEKWRNIRSAFLRSLKAVPGGTKVKKPYYLSEHLKFVSPYMKHHNSIESHSGHISSPPLENRDSILEIMDDADESVDSTESHATTFAAPAMTSPLPASDTRPFSPTSSKVETARRRRKRPSPDVEEILMELLKNQNDQMQTRERTPQHRNRTPKNPMHYFLFSLLPEFDDMTENQKRHFKIQVMLLIDKIKNTHSDQANQIIISDNFAQAAHTPVPAVAPSEPLKQEPTDVLE